MENVLPIPGDKVREESSAHRIRNLKTKRKRLMKRNYWKSGSLPRLALSSDEACQQENGTKPPFRTVFKCVNTSLLAIVGIKYQAISQDPSNILALNTWSFLIAIFIYSLILFAMKQSQNINLQIILGRVALASGVVSSVSLMSLLLPRFYGLMVLCISWALLVVLSALPILRRAYNGLLEGITPVINILISLARNLFTGNESSQQQAPPQGTSPPV